VSASNVDAAIAFFEPALEPGLKAPFMRRSSTGAENALVFLRMSSGRVASRGAATAPRLFAGTAAATTSLALTAALAVALTVLVTPSASAGRQGDHDKARAAVQAGEVLPLPTLLQRLQRTHPGTVLELELEFEGVVDERAVDGRTPGRKPGRWLYEVKLLQADGRLLKLEVDAATAEVLKVKRESGRGDRKRGRDQLEPPRAKDDPR